MQQFFLGLVLVLGSLAQAQDFSYNQSEDVFIRHSNKSTTEILGSKSAPTDLKDCRARISKIVCWVNPLPPMAQRDENDPCLAGGEKFVHYFEEHFDRAPTLIKTMYCHLDRLWIEKSTQATAYASPIMDSNMRMIAGGVGIRQEVFESPLGFDGWLSWKEESSFGGSDKTDAPRLGLIDYTSNKSEKGFLIDYVMTHEFGHLFDFANRLNRRSSGSWSELSWVDSRTPKKEDDYPYREDLCYYFCNGQFIPKSNAVTLFSGMMNTNFISTYASRHPAEDWAESFAIYIATEQLNLKYQINIQGKNFDMNEHFHSPLMKTKRDYVQKFLAGTVLYPGQTTGPVFE